MKAHETTVDPCVDPATVRSLRHSLSTASSFLKTSGDNLFGSKPDWEQARRLFQAGIAKVQAAVDDLDQMIGRIDELHDDGSQDQDASQ